MELDILHFMSDLHGTFFDKVMLFITKFGDAGIFWIALAIFFLCVRKYRKAGAGMAVSLIFSLIFCNLIFKNLVARERPFDTDITLDNLVHEGSFSFPSGHTSASFAAAMSLLYFHKKEGIAALVLAVLIAFSRIYICVHYPTDVLGGMVIGAVSAILSVLVIKYADSKGVFDKFANVTHKKQN